MLGGPVQLAYAVADVHDSVSEWVEAGVGPFFLNEHIELHDVHVRGAPGAFDHTSAFAWWGAVMIELIHEHRPTGDGGSAPIVGSTGLHHVAHFVDDFADAHAGLLASGFDEVLYAETRTGMPFAFHDALATRGHLVEIYERTPLLAGFYDMVRDASVGWSGAGPLRVL